jgi:hypothetical protein
MRTASQFANKQARLISSDIIGRTPIQRPEGEGHNAQLLVMVGRRLIPVLLYRSCSGARARAVFPKNTPKSAIARKHLDLRSGLFYP